MSDRIFFIAGAQRSGTTYLYDILDKHPQICMAKPVVPEPKFFLQSENVTKGKQFYLNKYFKPTDNTEILGEKSTSYMESTYAAQEIKNMFPLAKVIFILRNPVMRAISNFYFSTVNGLETRTIREVFLQKKLSSIPYFTSVSPFKYIERGEYLKYLTPYVNLFGLENIKILIFEKMIQGPEFLSDLFEFLHVGLVNEKGFTNTKVNAAEEDYAIDRRIKRELMQHFEIHNRMLSESFKIDLSIWRK